MICFARNRKLPARINKPSYFLIIFGPFPTSPRVVCFQNCTGLSLKPISPWSQHTDSLKTSALCDLLRYVSDRIMECLQHIMRSFSPSVCSGIQTTQPNLIFQHPITSGKNYALLKCIDGFWRLLS